MPKFAARNLVKFPNAIYFVSVFLIILLTLVYLIYEFHKQLVISAKQQYIGLVSTNLISADQSMDELINTLNIGKISYQKVLGTAQASGDLNYSIIFGNSQKSLSQIGLLKDNLDFQKNLLASSKTPKEYQSLENGFNDYYLQSSKLLEKLEQNYAFENNILANVGSSNLGINISQENLWKSADKAQILDYFKTLKSDTDSSLEKLSRINVPDKYKKYYELYFSNLKLLASTAEEIVGVLEQDLQIVDSDYPNSIEIAYRTSIDTQNEMNKLSEEISAERERIFATEENLKAIEKLGQIQQDLEDEIKNFYSLLYIESNSP